MSKVGIQGKVLSWLEDYLKDRKQRVILNGQSFPETHIAAGVPQGSILGPQMFLLYMNNLIENLTTETRLYADDASLFTEVTDRVQGIRTMDENLDAITTWAKKWHVKFNPNKTKNFPGRKTKRN